jgi:hypothetical protein
MHLSTSIGTGKAPMDLAALRVAFACQGFNVLPQMIKLLTRLDKHPRSKMLISISAMLSQLPCLGV